MCVPKPESRVGVSRTLAPAVAAPMHDRRRAQIEAQAPAGGQRAAFLVGPPDARCASAPLRPDSAGAAAAACRRRAPSRSERSSLICSACAQTSGIAEPDGRPRNSSRSGMSSASQTCSGSRWPSLAKPSKRAQQRLGLGAVAGGQLVMRALAGEQRPGPADAGAVERRAVLVLAIAVAVVAAPARARRQLDLEQRVDDTRRVLRMRGSSGARSPKRTSASASGLTISDRRAGTTDRAAGS